MTETINQLKKLCFRNAPALVYILSCSRIVSSMLMFAMRRCVITVAVLVLQLTQCHVLQGFFSQWIAEFQLRLHSTNVLDCKVFDFVFLLLYTIDSVCFGSEAVLNEAGQLKYVHKFQAMFAFLFFELRSCIKSIVEVFLFSAEQLMVSLCRSSGSSNVQASHFTIKCMFETSILMYLS